jgi:hypothetical protein
MTNLTIRRARYCNADGSAMVVETDEFIEAEGCPDLSVSIHPLN